ncbi:HVO_2901 family zinc finger protein [Natronomonas sp. EA1]|uniref:HVO_2901 family zinc finger protein n=1 Tax=Natronomonas sp. EA1 TaxID=3421655 RepID=UPI003EC0B5F2
MTHTCRNCKRAFGTKLEYELHQDKCAAEQLLCRKCGEKFAERTATRDGWYYRCPNDECDGEGIGEDLYAVDELLVATR